MAATTLKSENPKTRANNRIEALLDASARQFAESGYKATTTRDIAKNVNMQPGSVYYHFKSKGELLLAVYQTGVQRVSEKVTRAIAGQSEPLAKLKAALNAHLEVILDESAYARVLTTVQPGEVPEFEEQLIRLRNDYEQLFIDLMNTLPFKPGTDKNIIRMLMIGAANYTQWWYRPGGKTPSYLAEQLAIMIEGCLEEHP